MNVSGAWRWVGLAAPMLLLAGCGSEVGGEDGGGAGSSGAHGTGASPGDGGSSAGGSGATAGGGGTATGGQGSAGSSTGGQGGFPPTNPNYLPARVRRLTNAEYDASVQALLGTEQAPGEDFPPDARQHGYTLNEAQRIDPVLARALDGAAIDLAEEARARFGELAPCANPADEAECASSFIEDFGSRAYRRPLDDSDRAGLLSLYQAGAEGASYEDGIALVIRGVLQSPGFLYLTELGTGAGDDLTELTQYELASQLSYTITGGPPDEALLAAAAAGTLSSKDERGGQVRRLFETEAGRARAVELVRQWLGIDRIFNTSKDSTVYEEFADVRDAMAKETEDFVLEVLDTASGTVGDFLGADWTVVDADLAQAYQLSGSGRVQTPGRIGLLNQGAFLSVYAHAHETAPVLRGVAVMRRVTCKEIELPTDLDVQIIPPLPDPEMTTRERFSVHAADPECANCHNLIDPLGFSFEHLDGMGAPREDENGKAIDSTVQVRLGESFDGPYSDSNELASALAGSAAVRECFARQMFRASAGEARADTVEEVFIEAWQAMSPDEQGALLDLLVAFAESDLFVKRGTP